MGWISCVLHVPKFLLLNHNFANAVHKNTYFAGVKEIILAAVFLEGKHVIYKRHFLS